MREIASGIGLLAQCDDPGPWLWARVAGDAVDMATLAARAFDGTEAAHDARLGMALASPIGALDLMFALMARSRSRSRAAATYDYSDRVGLGGPPSTLRGAARDAPVPADLRTPPALRPYATAAP
jgi:hypothetical protein